MCQFLQHNGRHIIDSFALIATLAMVVAALAIVTATLASIVALSTVVTVQYCRHRRRSGYHRPSPLHGLGYRIFTVVVEGKMT